MTASRLNTDALIQAQRRADPMAARAGIRRVVRMFDSAAFPDATLSSNEQIQDTRQADVNRADTGFTRVG